jgi:hypothetical protein
MRKILCGSVLISSLIICGCHFNKPAYEDVKVDKKTTGETKPAEQAANPEQKEDPVAKAEKEAGLQTPAQPSAPAEEKQPVQIPEFLDMNKGQIKDLPPYPKAARTNMQYGPINGVSSAMYVYVTNESPATISAFYEKAFQSNGWRILAADKVPDSYEYTLAKGTRDQALIRIKKDVQSHQTSILLSRAQVPEGQSVTAAPANQPEKKKN